ncbi:MAG: heavy-metal-associated domain-containing protein [Campylobacteraceae bacterium]|jgi:copper chaperone CopZ|nr:heavy-metal-associated domain-containing protein [Campylobacteraceae bacterium]
MKIRYSVDNIHCQKCANTILNSLSDEFTGIEILLDKEPKEIVAELTAEQEQRFKDELDDIGYPVIEELERS